MTVPVSPNTSEPIVQTDSQGKILSGVVKSTWYQFFQNLISGDSGTNFTPNIVNLSSAGTPTITGYYYDNQGFVDFWVKITPATSISGTAGVTYIELPFVVSNDAPCFAVSGSGGAIQAIGVIDAATARCYPPTFTGITVPLTITGRVVSQ